MAASTGGQISLCTLLWRVSCDKPLTSTLNRSVWFYCPLILWWLWSRSGCLDCSLIESSNVVPQLLGDLDSVPPSHLPRVVGLSLGTAALRAYSRPSLRWVMEGKGDVCWADVRSNGSVSACVVPFRYPPLLNIIRVFLEGFSGFRKPDIPKFNSYPDLQMPGRLVSAGFSPACSCFRGKINRCVSVAVFSQPFNKLHSWKSVYVGSRNWQNRSTVTTCCDVSSCAVPGESCT